MEKTMKIAITSTGNSLDNEIDPRFGRAAFFIIYDTETKQVRFLENSQSLNTPAGAGIQAAQKIIDAGAQALLTGHCGPNAFRALDAAGVTIYINVSGLVQDAIQDFNKGKLEKAEKADVESHWI
jgi:predicted Fe-Mo cluster-binding NifX family protein